MDKILEILAVFVLLSLVIHRFIRGREPAYRPYDYLNRIKLPLPDAGHRLVSAAFEPGGEDAFIVDEGRQLLFTYKAEGSLVIHRRKGEDRLEEMQWLAAPLNCTGMTLDAEDGKLYLEAGGYLFLFGC